MFWENWATLLANSTGAAGLSAMGCHRCMACGGKFEAHDAYEYAAENLIQDESDYNTCPRCLEQEKKEMDSVWGVPALCDLLLSAKETSPHVVQTQACQNLIQVAADRFNPQHAKAQPADLAICRTYLRR